MFHRRDSPELTINSSSCFVPDNCISPQLGRFFAVRLTAPPRWLCLGQIPRQGLWPFSTVPVVSQGPTQRLSLPLSHQTGAGRRSELGPGGGHSSGLPGPTAAVGGGAP